MAALEAKVTYVDGMQFVGEAGSGHAVVMDADASVGGRNTGIRPTELLLVGLGSCSGMDIISILKKKKQAVTGLEIIVKGSKAETYPKRFIHMEIEFVVRGRSISPEAMQRAVDLSMEKYCSVKATLEKSAEITFSYRIVEE